MPEEILTGPPPFSACERHLALFAEIIDMQAWPTRAMARRAVADYIGWHNGTRG